MAKARKHPQSDPGRNVLITGINGFVGSHLAEACRARAWRVFGTIRSFRSPLKNVAGIPEARLVPCDVTDYQSLAAVVRETKPHYVFHLAAQSFVPASWTAPRATLDANVIGTLNVLEAVRAFAPGAAVQIAGSSEEYGMVQPQECPITEAQPLRPLSPYGVSKAAADQLARQYAASYGLRVIVTRAFNHTGPRRGAAFAESQWARAIAWREAGLETGPVLHGALEAVRDYTDVRDIVQGYIAAVERGTSGAVYNLGWGESQSPTMNTVLALLRELATVPITTAVSPQHMRPSDVPRLVADASLARAAIGWDPKIVLGVTLADLLNYWRSEAEQEKLNSRRENMTKI